ncbi:LuxR family transcriptional regulator [Caballeronia peredens]|nr:LuxR family transcriptional regulator [Caballeronia peredens]
MATREVKTGKPEALDAILAQFYEAVLDPNALLSALTDFDTWLGSELCHMLGWNRLHDCPQFSFMSDPAYHPAGDAYASYFASRDPRRALVNGMPEGQVVHCADYFDTRFVDRSEFYQDLLLRNNIRYSVGGCALRDDAVDVLVVFNHCVGQPAFSDIQVQGLKRLFPHLRQTFRLISRTESLRAGLFAGDAALQAMGQAVVVLNARNDIVFCTSAAEQILNERKSQRVLPSAFTGTSLFSEIVRSTFQRVRVTRHPESVIAATSLRSYYLTAIPFPREGVQDTQLSCQLRGATSWGSSTDINRRLPSFRDADLIIVISPDPRDATVSAQQLMQLFKLSPAEARLAHNLAKGKSIEEHAQVVGVSIATARNQLRSVLEKTGLGRQQNLVRVLSQLPSVKDRGE